jgi:hypothetical protein
VRVQRDLVDEQALIEEGHEHAARRRLAAAVDPHRQLDARRVGCVTMRTVAVATPSRGVVAVHLHVGLRHGRAELRDAPRHRARVPMLQHAAGAQPEGVLGVGDLGRRVVGWNQICARPSLVVEW